LKDEKLTKSKPTWKLKHANYSKLFYLVFWYFCQMTSKSICMILSFQSWCIFWDTVLRTTDSSDVLMLSSQCLDAKQSKQVVHHMVFVLRINALLSDFSCKYLSSTISCMILSFQSWCIFWDTVLRTTDSSDVLMLSSQCLDAKLSKQVVHHMVFVLRINALLSDFSCKYLKKLMFKSR